MAAAQAIDLEHDNEPPAGGRFGERQAAITSLAAEWATIRPPRARPAWPSAPLPEIAVLPPRACSTSSLVTVLMVLGDDFARELLLQHVPFCARQALAAACFDTRQLHVLRHAVHLLVHDADATWLNATFVARLPCLRTLRVEGETSLPVMHLSHYRTLPRLKVGAVGVTAALFLGAAIAKCDCVLRLSDGLMLRNLKGLRESARVNFPSAVSPADVAAMLGALCLNPHIVRIDEWYAELTAKQAAASTRGAAAAAIGGALGTLDGLRVRRLCEEAARHGKPSTPAAFAYMDDWHHTPATCQGQGCTREHVTIPALLSTAAAGNSVASGSEDIPPDVIHPDIFDLLPHFEGFVLEAVRRGELRGTMFEPGPLNNGTLRKTLWWHADDPELTAVRQLAVSRLAHCRHAGKRWMT